MFRSFFIIISVASTLQFLFAELVFDNMEINDKIKSEIKEYPFTFRFSNNSASAIKILDIVSSCDCTKLHSDKKQYQPNENGKINGIFTIGERKGVQKKSFILTTDEKKNSKYELSLHLVIEAPANIYPKVLIWNFGESSTKELSIKTSKNYKLSKIDLGSKLFDVKNRISTSNSIEITPLTHCPRGKHVLKLFFLQNETNLEYTTNVYLIVK